LKKIKTCRPILGGYHGIHQIQHSNGYKTKCITCIKNIRHSLCPHFKCGACCDCKFHKSHYQQMQPNTYHLFSYVSVTSTSLKVKMKQQYVNSSHRSKRYYYVKIET